MASKINTRAEPVTSMLKTILLFIIKYAGCVYMTICSPHTLQPNYPLIYFIYKNVVETLEKLVGLNFSVCVCVCVL